MCVQCGSRDWLVSLKVVQDSVQSAAYKCHHPTFIGPNRLGKGGSGIGREQVCHHDTRKAHGWLGQCLAANVPVCDAPYMCLCSPYVMDT
jgi:hypothetical protein